MSEPWRRPDAATFDLARFVYATGPAVASDKAQILALFRRAAEQGVAYAQVGLGEMYATGQGVDRDDALAAAWFHKAAGQGNSDAQYDLGVMVETGRGVRQDKA